MSGQLLQAPTRRAVGKVPRRPPAFVGLVMKEAHLIHEPPNA
jgi:hypothetical protein